MALLIESMNSQGFIAALLFLLLVMQIISDVPEESQRMVYAGRVKRCAGVSPPGHKHFDPQFNAASGGRLNCHPLYQEGAFYVLGEALIQHLNRSRAMLTVMTVEDAMVGSWLLGINKVLVMLSGEPFHCPCGNNVSSTFYHNCNTGSEMEACVQLLGSC